MAWYLTLAPIGIYAFWLSPYNICVNYWYLVEMVTMLLDSISRFVNWILNGPGGAAINCADKPVCDGSCGEKTSQVKPLFSIVRDLRANRYLSEDALAWAKYYGNQYADGAIFVGGVAGAARVYKGYLKYFPTVPRGTVGSARVAVSTSSVPAVVTDAGTVSARGKIITVEKSTNSTSKAINKLALAAVELEKQTLATEERLETELERRKLLSELAQQAVQSAESMKNPSYKDVYNDIRASVKKNPSLVIAMVAVGTFGVIGTEVSVKPPVEAGPTK